MKPSFAATLALTLALALLTHPLHTDAAPSGIVSYELAWTAERATEILASWDHAARVRAAWAQALDCLYPVAYGSLGVAIGRWAGTRLGARLCVAAALLDGLVENPMLDLELWWGEGATVPALIAAVAACGKFGALLLAIPLAVAARWRGGGKGAITPSGS